MNIASSKNHSKVRHSTPQRNIPPLRLLLYIWSYLNQRRKIQLLFILALMLLSMLAELITLGSIFPFLNIISRPELVINSKYFIQLSNIFDIVNYDVIPSVILSLFVIIVIMSTLIRIVNLWANGKISALIASDLSCNIYQKTLHQPYEIQIQKNSSEILNAITKQVTRSVYAFNAALQFSTAALVSIGLIALLVITDWKVALSSSLLFLSLYYIIAKLSKPKLQENSRLISLYSGNLIKCSQEGLGGIRDIILDRSYDMYLNIYRSYDRPLRLLEVENIFISSYPRYVLESFGLLLLASIGLIYLLTTPSNLDLIAVLGTFGLGMQRLLPSLQNAYRSWARLNNFQADLDAILKLLQQPMPKAEKNIELCTSFNHFESIEFQEVSYCYGKNINLVNKNISFEIVRGDIVGVKGSSGSGKTTLIDLVMGFLVPTFGEIIVNNNNLHDHNNYALLNSWRNSIAHVPQSIFLSDTSIAENIAFGVPAEDIDFRRLRAAAEIAHISSYVESLPDSYSSLVGERGVQLSGGQRQRIGIARALYKEAQILILDEATSALDHETESAIVDAITSNAVDITIIMIAHRLTTLRNCNKIIELQDGEILDIA